MFTICILVNTISIFICYRYIDRLAVLIFIGNILFAIYLIDTENSTLRLCHAILILIGDVMFVSLFSRVNTIFRTCYRYISWLSCA